VATSADQVEPQAVTAEPEPSVEPVAAVVAAEPEPSVEPVAAVVAAEPEPSVEPVAAAVAAEPEPRVGAVARPAGLAHWRERLRSGNRRSVLVAARRAARDPEPAAVPSVSGKGGGEMATALRGKAASAMARWRWRRHADGGGTAGPGLADLPRLSPFTAELTGDILRLTPAVLLCVIGIALTYCVCVPIDGAPERLYWRRQSAFLAVGLGLYAVIGKVNNAPISRRMLMRILYAILCIGLPVLVLLLGRATGNGLRWLNLFGLLSIQPAEFAKIALIWVVAELVNPEDAMARVAVVRRHLLAVLAVAVPVALVFMERSMGNTALLCLSVGTVLATRWFSWPILLGLLLAGLVGLAPVGRAIVEIRNPTPGIDVARWQAREGRSEAEPIPIGLSVREVSSVVAPAGATGLLSHCPDRFACYLSQHGGWNARQALRCVRLGGVDGSGWRKGIITILGYLPRTVQHTDFIYCVLSESFGFLGGLLVLGLIAWLIVVILWNGVHSPHPAAWSFSVGFATLLFLQTLIHVGMALRLLPIIGIPLPFVSYGGSFLVTSFAALGLVARYSAAVPAEPRVVVQESPTPAADTETSQRLSSSAPIPA
jgi:rod shape determining protein RodA